MIQISTIIRNWARAWWPAWVASTFMLVTTLEVVFRSVSLNHALVYALDDAYIHMSIAKNLVREGVWGVSALSGFSSASSSPLWTTLIAISYVVFGVNEWTPLVMNILLGIGAMFTIHAVLRRNGVLPLYSVVVQIAVVILMPMNTLILTGMEHVLQSLVNVAFLGLAAEMVSAEKSPPIFSWKWASVLVLGALVGSARYEGLFLVLIFCILFAARWRWAHGFTLGAVSILPALIFGLIAMGQGWEFLPTSLLIKSDANYLRQAGFGALIAYFVHDTYAIIANQHVFSLPLLAGLAMAIYRYSEERRFWSPPLVMALAFVGITLINVRLVSWPFPGTYARYEAYLIPLGWVALMAGLGACLPRRFDWRTIPVYALACVLVMFLLNDVYNRYRFIAYQNPVVTGTTNIDHQQYQMAHFLHEFYEGEVIAANDIGAINFFAEIDTIDLWGLGSIEVATARRENRYNTEFIRHLTTERGAKIAVIYANWYDGFGGSPPEWVLVGQWRVSNNVILGNDTVSFYAIDPAEVERLQANLSAYEAVLPSEIAPIYP